MNNWKIKCINSILVGCHLNGWCSFAITIMLWRITEESQNNYINNKQSDKHMNNWYVCE